LLKLLPVSGEPFEGSDRFEKFDRLGRLRLSDQFNNNAGVSIAVAGFLCWPVHSACSKRLSTTYWWQYRYSAVSE